MTHIDLIVKQKLQADSFLGAIIGDIVGSVYEWNNIRTKEFLFFGPKCFPTDDSIMTLAVAKAILDSDHDYSALSQRAIDRACVF